MELGKGEQAISCALYQLKTDNKFFVSVSPEKYQLIIEKLRELKERLNQEI